MRSVAATPQRRNAAAPCPLRDADVIDPAVRGVDVQDAHDLALHLRHVDGALLDVRTPDGVREAVVGEALPIEGDGGLDVVACRRPNL